MIRHRWRTHLKATATEPAVVELVQAYLREWRPEEIASVPPRAWPTRVHGRSDIMAWMFAIGEVHSDFRGEPAALARLQELLLFFTHAAVRVTQIRSPAEDREPANDEQAALETSIRPAK